MSQATSRTAVAVSVSSTSVTVRTATAGRRSPSSATAVESSLPAAPVVAAVNGTSDTSRDANPAAVAAAASSGPGLSSLQDTRRVVDSAMMTTPATAERTLSRVDITSPSVRN